MKIPEQAAKELAQIWSAHFGHEISTKEAQEYSEQLLSMLGFAIREGSLHATGPPT